MKKIFLRIYYLTQLYTRFGYRGILFYLKCFFKWNQTISFSHDNYLHPITLRNNTTDIPTFEEVIVNQNCSIKYDFEPEVIIDCGAHIGLASVFFINKFPKSKIISIEPEQSNFEMLLKNTKDYGNIHCLNCGVWNKSANLLIKDNEFGNWAFSVEEVDFCNENTIPAITINDIMKRYNFDKIDILKINIEGSEKELFESNFEEWLSKTKIVIIDLHDSIRNGASRSFFKALSNYNFSLSLNRGYFICRLN
jgi:FkbM family methyltransferase